MSFDLRFTVAQSREVMLLMPTPRATWLEEPRSVDTDPIASNVALVGTACSAPMPNGSFLRRGSTCADHDECSDPREPSPSLDGAV
jgi:hypothetical protein